MDHARQGVLRRAIYGVARRAARAYVVGDHIAAAAAACERLGEQGLRAAVGYWNAVGEHPGDVYREYAAALAETGHLTDRPYLCVKAPALAFRPDLALAIGQATARAAIRLHFDSHGPEVVDRMRALVEPLRRERSLVGFTLPGRWARSVADAAWAAEAGLFVRVVKGQWPDEGDGEQEPRAGFMSVIEALAGRARHVAVATHDVGLAQAALTRLTAAGTPCELELLYGLPLRASIALGRRLGVGVRVYVPYGSAFLPYSLERLRTQPRLAWWLLKDACSLRAR